MQVETTIHHVSKIKVLDIDELEASGEPFYTRRIVIIDANGHEVVLLAMADEKDSLAVLM